MALQPRLSARVSVVVAEGDTAQALGSGDVPVLATPRLLALAEAACCEAVEGHLEPHQTSVASRVQLEHLVASPPGVEVVVLATLAHVDGRLLRFEVLAEDHSGRLVAHGQVTRIVVDRERFLARARQPESS